MVLLLSLAAVVLLTIGTTALAVHIGRGRYAAPRIAELRAAR